MSIALCEPIKAPPHDYTDPGIWALGWFVQQEKEKGREGDTPLVLASGASYLLNLHSIKD